MRLTLPLLICIVLISCAGAAPVVFWAPDSVEPGNVVLLYGGDLKSADSIQISRLTDETPSQPVVTAKGSFQLSGTKTQPPLQPSDNSVKFILPADFAPGIFAAQVSAVGQMSAPVILNRPELWFCQPTTLLPGLRKNETASGATVQIIGKNFLLPGDKGAPRVVLKSGNLSIPLPVTNAERFSLLAQLPPNLAEGSYEL